MDNKKSPFADVFAYVIMLIVGLAIGACLGALGVLDAKPSATPTPRVTVIYVTPKPTPIPSPTLSLYDMLNVTATPRPTATPKPTPRPTPIPTVDVYEILASLPTPTPKPTATPELMGIMSEAANGIRTGVSTDRGVASVIIGQSANIRSGPGTDYKVLEKVLGGDRVYCLENGRKYGSNGWYKVRTASGTVGYVSPKLVGYNTTVVATPRPASGSQSYTSTQSRPQSTPRQEQMVWVSRTGDCYHSYSGCSNMSNPWYMSLSEARIMGRRPCQKCY